MTNPLEILNNFRGISIIEKSDKKFYIAFYVMKKEEGEIEYITGNFAASVFATDRKEAIRIAKAAESDKVELLSLINVKETLLSAAAQAQGVPLVPGVNQVM